MDLKSRLERQLAKIGSIADGLLAVFSTPKEWTHQVHAEANHPLWVVGHLGTVDNFLLSMVNPEQVDRKPGYQELFGMGSRPTGNPEDYPPVEEVLAFMRARRAALLDCLRALDDESLLKPLPENAPAALGADVASLFEAAVWHEALHLGQVTVARRALGHPPMADAPPRKSNGPSAGN